MGRVKFSEWGIQQKHMKEAFAQLELCAADNTQKRNNDNSGLNSSSWHSTASWFTWMSAVPLGSMERHISRRLHWLHHIPWINSKGVYIHSPRHLHEAEHASITNHLSPGSYGSPRNREGCLKSLVSITSPFSLTSRIFMVNHKELSFSSRLCSYSVLSGIFSTCYLLK